VSESIMEKINGSITVESELNKGSTFMIILPTD
jgi:chemotaxis protein histidine kinase CheA